jgi:hypothetical protein
MHDRSLVKEVGLKYAVLLMCVSLVFTGGYVTARWGSLPTPRVTGPAQAAAQPHHHPQEANDVDLAPFMIRNAYHFATLYHAARAGHWELAAYQAEELDENIASAAQAAAIYAPLLANYRKDFVQPLQQAVVARGAAQFSIAFRAAVAGCNQCHQATQHAFITIPEAPPSLSIFVLPPSGG